MGFVDDEDLPIERSEGGLIDGYELVGSQQNVELDGNILPHAESLVTASDCSFLEWKFVFPEMALKHDLHNDMMT